MIWKMIEDLKKSESKSLSNDVDDEEDNDMKDDGGFEEIGWKADPGLTLAASWIIQSFPARHHHPLTLDDDDDADDDDDGDDYDDGDDDDDNDDDVDDDNGNNDVARRGTMDSIGFHLQRFIRGTHFLGRSPLWQSYSAVALSSIYVHENIQWRKVKHFLSCSPA